MMYYEDFQLDQAIQTRSRVVTGTDIDLFAGLTGAVNPLFLSDEFAKKRRQKGRLTPGPLLFSLTIGLCYQAGAYDQVVAMAGVKEMKFLLPVHPGDMITATATPIDLHPSKKDDRGVVVLRHHLVNQNDERVLEADVTYLMRRKPI